MPDNINAVVQVVGRIHRQGQEHVQVVWTVCMLGMYDQWLYSNTTAMMPGQFSGGAHMENKTFDKADQERMLTAIQNMTGPAAHALIKQVKMTVTFNKLKRTSASSSVSDLRFMERNPPQRRFLIL
ncbi:uncharacterized protein A1O5_00613 [Cladophialophora psammophila CBS 110553]|uniref:Uncharacterized protein n=1 Tax=Cladophialophora psammophila CBS 110553 TaxID=1182543 RepID=W9XFJ3_9EURO|nr:uncharacterized protein A1O5_00613 [Cladophialophora psammophila CBS 110553]EXJ76105.1 hypothetical protein A1O5_00613 [Cladophialophora psammophila CBS 110553]